MPNASTSPYDDAWPGVHELLAVEIALNDPRTRSVAALPCAGGERRAQGRAQDEVVAGAGVEPAAGGL